MLLHKQRQDVLTEKADAILTSKIWGIPVFLGIMALTFLLTFSLGDWLKGWLELLIDWLSARSRTACGGERKCDDNLAGRGTASSRAWAR